MFYQIFLSPKVKQCAITTYEHGIWYNNFTNFTGKPVFESLFDKVADVFL